MEGAPGSGAVLGGPVGTGGERGGTTERGGGAGWDRLGCCSVVTLSRSPAYLTLLVLGSLTACNAGDSANTIRQALAEARRVPTTGTIVAFRFATEPGPGVRLYTLPGMDGVAWRFETPNLVAEELVGFAAAEEQIYVRAATGELRALDLESGRERTVDTTVIAAALGPTGVPHVVHEDGSVGTVVGRRAWQWEPILPELPRTIFGTTRGRLLAVLEAADSRRLELVGDSSRRVTAQLPAGLMASTNWGDLLAIAVDSGITAVRTSDGSNAGFVPLDTRVTAMTFSSSGHRLYAATAALEFLVVERFQFQILGRHNLPAPVEYMRAGALGHYVLMRPARRDSVWISDVMQMRPLSVRGSWEDDLPTIAPDGTVLLRQGRDVVAIDAATARETGRVPDGAEDRWLLVEWDPRRPTTLIARVSDTTTAEEPSDQRVYVQLSSTSNESWAQARVDELLQANLNARVLQPNEYYDRYRVVLGPYSSREDADNIGQRLGQPYFIIFLQDSTASNQ